MKYSLNPGCGFWDISNYVAGGNFKRVPRSSNAPVIVTDVEVIEKVNGCNRIGTDSPPNINHARSCAVWPDMPESMVCDKDARLLKITRDKAGKEVARILESRQSSLMAEFQTAMREAGFVWPTHIQQSIAA